MITVFIMSYSLGVNDYVGHILSAISRTVCSNQTLRHGMSEIDASISHLVCSSEPHDLNKLWDC